jgi:hypothetical protein
VQLFGELSGAAAEIDDPTSLEGLHERDEIPERSSAFGFESLVLSGIPLGDA